VSSSVAKDTVREQEDEDEEEDRVADTKAEAEVVALATEAARKGEDVTESRERSLRSPRIVRDGQAEGKRQQPQQRDHTQPRRS
jgi:hypothetical protein